MRETPISTAIVTAICWAVFVCVFASAPTWAQDGADTTLRIMPLGDSITRGNSSRNSYRRPLSQLLIDSELDFDFVGSRNTAVPDPDFDLDHQGHSGWTADDFLQNNRIRNWSLTYLPDLVLLHLGTNDLRQGQSVSSTVDEIGQIIDILREANPQVIVLLAQIVPMSTPGNPDVTPLNAAIPDLVTSKDSTDSPVLLVDHFTGFDGDADNVDGIHPNPSGEAKMAQTWFDAIQLVLDDDVNEAPAFTSTPVTTATQAMPYLYSVTVQDPDMDAVTIEALESPDWLIFVDNGDGTATLSGTPGNSDVGESSVRLVATDEFDLTAEQTFTITVANVNDAPLFSSAPVTTVMEAAEYSYVAIVEDLDADAVSITAETLPGWLTLSDNSDGTAILSGTPSGAEAGTHTVELRAEETETPEGLSAQQSFVITVEAAAEGPEIVLRGDTTVTIVQGEAYNDPGATASDMQDGDLTEQISVDNPVDSAVPATYSIAYSVSDSAGNEARAERTVTVRAQSTTNDDGQRGESDSGSGAAGVLELLLMLLAALSVAACRNRHRIRVRSQI